MGTISERMRPLLNPLMMESIKTDPRQLFFYVRLPEDVKNRLTDLGAHILSRTEFGIEENDHITLLYLPKDEQEVPEWKVNDVLTTARTLVATHKPITARIQGYAYFDGAMKDKMPKTALVALIDAPGLAELHVDLARMMRTHGFIWNQTHGFTPHATFAYLPPGTRTRELPVIENLSFEIREIELSNREYYRLPLGDS